MPTYEYACSSCRRRFDVVQSFADDALTVCDECGGALKRVFHPIGVVLKGSGFYATDNRSKGALAPKDSSSERAQKKGEKSTDGSSSSSSGSSSSGESSSSSSSKSEGSSSSSTSSSSSSSSSSSKSEGSSSATPSKPTKKDQ